MSLPMPAGYIPAQMRWSHVHVRLEKNRRRPWGWSTSKIRPDIEYVCSMQIHMWANFRPEEIENKCVRMYGSDRRRPLTYVNLCLLSIRTKNSTNETISFHLSRHNQSRKTRFIIKKCWNLRLFFSSYFPADLITYFLSNCFVHVLRRSMSLFRFTFHAKIT